MGKGPGVDAAQQVSQGGCPSSSLEERQISHRAQSEDAACSARLKNGRRRSSARGSASLRSAVSGYHRQIPRNFPRFSPVFPQYMRNRSATRTPAHAPPRPLFPFIPKLGNFTAERSKLFPFTCFRFPLTPITVYPHALDYGFPFANSWLDWGEW